MGEVAQVQSHARDQVPKVIGTGSLEVYSKFFGPQQGLMEPSAFERTPYTHYDLPEALRGQNLYLRDTVVGLVLSGEEWYTTLGLPWGQTDKIEVRWNEWHFNKGLAGRVPHEGISRLVTSSKLSRNARVIRRGLGFVMEADFLRTAEGQQHYQRNIIGIANIVQLTQNYDTLFAIVTAHTAGMLWEQKFGTSRVALQQLVDEENLNYAAMADPDPDQARLYFIVNRHREAMKLEQAEAPDLLILGPGMAAYLPMAPPVRTEYFVAGAQGQLEKREGPQALASVYGMRTVETDPFSVEDDGPAVNLLARPSQIGEFYSMRLSPSIRAGSGINFMRKARDIKIHDENDDRMADVLFKDAFRRTFIFKDHVYHSELALLVDNYNDRQQPPPVEGEGVTGEHDGSVSADGVQRIPQNAPAFFLAAHQSGVEKPWFLIERFGQLEYTAATTDDFARISESIASSVVTYDEGAINRLAQLVHQIESQPYDEAFFSALISTNTPSNITAEDRFTGETTPGDLARHWNAPQLVEWKGNQYGGVNLPRSDAVKGMRFPPGFANVPGLRTLAAEASHNNSPWQNAGVDARDGIAALSHIVDTLKRVLPHSDALAAINRAPWFHRDDPLTVFFSNAFGVARDPLFLMHLPAVTSAAGTVVGETTGVQQAAAAAGAGAGAHAPIPWFVIPGSFVNVTDFGTVTDDDVQRALASVRNGTLPDAAIASIQRTGPGGAGGAATVKIFSPALGAAIDVPVGLFQRSTMLSRELQTVGAMPDGANVAAHAVREANLSIMAQIANVNNYADRAAAAALTEPTTTARLSTQMMEKYQSFVLRFASQKPEDMWLFVLGLNSLLSVGNSEGLFAAIDQVAVSGAGATPEMLSDARARIAALKNIGSSVVLPSLPAGATLDGAKQLHESWAAFVGEGFGGARGAVVGFDDLGHSAQTMIEEEANLVAIATAAGVAVPDFSGGTALTNAAIARGQTLVAALGAAAGGAPFVQAATASVAALAAAFSTFDRRLSVSGLGAVARGDAVAELETAATREVTGSARVMVDSSPTGRAMGQYFRAPLTSSMAMVQSLSDQFAATDGARPLALPGDGITNSYPFMGSVDIAGGGFIVPQSIWDRPAYKTKSEYEATDFAQRGVMHSRAQVHAPEDVAFGDSSGFGGAAASAAASAARSTFGIADADDDNFADMDLVFGAPERGAAAAKRRRHMMGAPMAGGAALAAELALAGSVAPASYRHTETFVRRWKDTDDLRHPLVRMCARAFLLTRSDVESSWIAMIDNDAIVPVNIDIWRPFIEHIMSSMILMKGGYDTGANLHGYANFSTSVDNIAKTIYGNLTFYSKAIIWKPKNVHVARDVKPHAYLGGANTVFADKPEDFDVEHINRASMLAIATPLTEPAMPSLMSLGGYLDEPGLNIHIDGPLRPTYSTYEYYDGRIWGFTSDRKTRTSREDDDFLTEPERVTLVGQRGLQYNIDSVELGGGPRRKRVYPGCSPVWNGADKSFDNFVHPLHA